MLEDRNGVPYEWDAIKDRILEYIGIGRSEFVNTFHVFVTHLIDGIVQNL